MASRNVKWVRGFVALCATGLMVYGAQGFKGLRKRSRKQEKPFMSEWKFVSTFASFFTSAIKHSMRLRVTAATSAILSFLLSRFTAASWKRLGIFFFSMLWYIDYLLEVIEVPEVGCKGTFFNRRIVSLMHNSLRRYYPCFWLANSNFCTVGAALIRDAEFFLYSKMTYETDLVLSYDGVNTFSLDWYQPENGDTARKDPMIDSDRPVVILVHGLGGSSEEAYLKKIARKAHEHGWRCVSFDYWRLDFAEYRDLDIAINRVRKANPLAPLALVGVSAGTHICMRYLQVLGKDSPLCCAVLQSSVFDLLQEYQIVREKAEAGSAVKKGYKAFMDNAIARMATRHICNDKRPDFNSAAIQKMIDEGNNADQIYDSVIYAQPTRSELPLPVSRSKAELDFRERRRKFSDPRCCYSKVDGQQICEGVRVLGVGNERHYNGLAMPYISSVEVTTLMIHAIDDPVVGHDSIDWFACSANKNIITVKTKRGGHVGWLSGSLPFGSSWADDCSVDFIRSVLEVHSSTNFMLDMVRRMSLCNSTPNGFNDSSGYNASLLGASKSKPSVEQLARICSASDLPSMDAKPLTGASF